MLSAFYDRVKSLFGLETDSRKRRISVTDSAGTPNVKIRRIDKPLGSSNSPSSMYRNLPTMSKLDSSHLVNRREHSDEEFSWEKRNLGKENQFTRNAGCQVSDPDVVVIEDDFEEISHLKSCNHGYKKCEGAHRKDIGVPQAHGKAHSMRNEEVVVVDDDEDLTFIRDLSRPKKTTSFTPWPKPITFSERIREQKQPISDDLEILTSGPKSNHNGSWFGLDKSSQIHIGGYPEVKKMSSPNRLDSSSVKARIRAGNLSRAAVLRKSLPAPPTYFGVEPKLCTRWSGLDSKMRKKPTALALCSALSEMQAYNHMLQQFTSESAPKKMNTRFDSEAFKLFESQLKRNYSYSQLLKKRTGVERAHVVETIDLSSCEDDAQEVAFVDEARGPIAKSAPDNDVIEILPRKDNDTVQVVPRKVDVQRTRERVPKASGEREEADKKDAWAPPNAVEQLIKKSHVTDKDYLKNMVDRFANEKANIEKELEREHLKKKLWSERRQKFELSLEERVKRYMKITEVVLEDKEIAEEEEVLPELTQEMLDAVYAALQKGRSCILARLGSNTITGADIQTLSESNWLNDEVINNYMDMLTQRGQSEGYPSIYCFNTFFYPKLNSSGYSSIRRWTKKVDIFQKDMLIIPLHLEIHWALAVVDFRQKTICYYDSMNGRKKNILQVILKYLQDEKNDKKKENFDGSGWQMKLIQDIPQQENGHDCGVFACMFAEHLSRGVVSGDSKKSPKCSRTYPPFPFSQNNMPYFRKRMIYEILSGKLLQ